MNTVRRGAQIAFTLLLINSLAFLWGQSYQGGLRGRVVDEQGAVIANAKVQIVDVATNVTRDTATNSEGEFVFSAVNPATYEVTAENAGFKKFNRKVIIGTQEFITLDIRLEVGAVTESVVVNEETPLMETSNASQGTLLDRQKLVDLPNIGRNPFIMAWVAPGVIPQGDARFVRFQDQSGSSQVSFAGGPQRGNVYLLDGVPITDSINRAVIIPSIEAVEEMKIQMNTYDAELGRYAGGVYNSFMKSGSNDIHGSVFGSLRTTELFANDFFANKTGQARANQPYKLFGASVGGPIVLPKIYNGKNKTFFWLVFEGYRMETGQFNTFAMPTDAERGGDFSQTHNADGSLHVIYDPATTVRNADGSYTRQPFQGNVVPLGRQNSVGQNVAAFFRSPTTDTAHWGSPNEAVSAVLHDRANEYTGKFDHSFTNWWRANLSYLHYGSREPGPDWWGDAANPRGDGWQLLRYADVTTTNQTITVNPTTVLNLRYGYVRFPNTCTHVGMNFPASALGFPASYTSAIQNVWMPVIHLQDLVGGSQLGSGADSSYVPNSKSFLASVAKFVGKHNVKAGFQFRQLNWRSIARNGGGDFYFDDQFTRANPISRDGQSGADMASILLGIPSSGQVTLQQGFEGIFKYYGYYFHDDFRITPNLTLNLGMRYEFEQGYRDRNNRLIVGFGRDAVNPIAGQLPAGSGVLPRGGLQYAGVDGNPTQLGNPSYLRFAPRLGAAWRLNDKTTIRGGYGTFWAPPVYGGALSAPGYAQSTPYIGSIDGGVTPCPGCSLSNPYPNGLLDTVGNIYRTQTGLGNAVTFYNENMRHGGYVHQYSIDVQRTLPGGFNFSVAYVGSLSRHLQQNSYALNQNQLDPNYFSMGNSLLDPVENPFYGLKGPYETPPGFFNNPTVTRAQLLLPFPQFTTVSMGNPTNARARYDSFVFKVEKRFSGGLSVLAHLVASKTMDMAAAGTQFAPAAGFFVQNAYDYDAEYSLAAQNVPRRFVGVATYDLPFGKGRKFFSNSRLAGYTIGGWQFNVISTIQTGMPLSVGQGNNNAFAGTGGQRPNATGASPTTKGDIGSRLDQYINPAAFSLAPAFTFGNVSRTISDRAPGQVNFDVSLFKTVAIKERLHLQFRAEAMNFTNTPRFIAGAATFSGYSTNADGKIVANGGFGAITGQANFPRFIQIGGRIYW